MTRSSILSWTFSYFFLRCFKSPWFTKLYQGILVSLDLYFLVSFMGVNDDRQACIFSCFCDCINKNLLSLNFELSLVFSFGVRLHVKSRLFTSSYSFFSSCSQGVEVLCSFQRIAIKPLLKGILKTLNFRKRSRGFSVHTNTCRGQTHNLSSCRITQLKHKATLFCISCKGF